MHDLESGDPRKDWKAEYQELLNRHQADAQERRDIEALLSRTIVRVTLAANGLDAQLDPHLKSLRDAVRNGVKPSLKQRLDELSDALIRSSDLPDALEGPAIAHPGCRRLVEHRGLAADQANQVLALCGRLLAEPHDLSVAELDQLLGLLGTEGTSARTRSGGGLFQRMLGRAEESRTGSGVVEPRAVVNALLNEMVWPPMWVGEIDQLRRKLDQGPHDVWKSVIRDLARMMAKALSKVELEIRDTEGFLAQLTERLLEVDAHMRAASADSLATLESNRNLGRAVTEQVGGIASSVRDARDLQQLRQAIGERLDAIQTTMNQHLAAETERVRRAEEKAGNLKQHLDQLEREAHDLRRQMIDAHYSAMNDVVTNLPNRAAYEERLAQEHARWKRFREPLAMIVWDIDDFKSINDRFGHQAGDKALRVIADTLRGRLRETDFIARYGGEEFVVLMVGAGLAEAQAVAEQMREAVAHVGFFSQDTNVQVTISCGLTEFREGDAPGEVFARADKALYRAKSQGKNRCSTG